VNVETVQPRRQALIFALDRHLVALLNEVDDAVNLAPESECMTQMARVGACAFFLSSPVVPRPPALSHTAGTSTASVTVANLGHRTPPSMVSSPSGPPPARVREPRPVPA